jgi:thioredoxin-like negative regulator of GroEL
MSGLLFLTTDDFNVGKSVKGPVLRHSIPGFSIVLFYSVQCKHCQKLIPMFKRLPGSVGGCQFGMINVSSNKAAVKMSAGTIAPIEYVPYIILYVDGMPFMRYSGPHELSELKRFVLEVATKVRGSKKLSKGVVRNSEKTIPAYCIGQPLYGRTDVEYLIWDEGYKSK